METAEWHGGLNLDVSRPDLRGWKPARARGDAKEVARSRPDLRGWKQDRYQRSAIAPRWSRPDLRGWKHVVATKHAAAFKVPTRLEGMETSFASAHAFFPSLSRPDLRGWKRANSQKEVEGMDASRPDLRGWKPLKSPNLAPFYTCPDPT